MLHCFGDAAQHILGVDDADDIVDVVLIDRDSGVAFVDGKLDDVHHGSGVFYGGDVSSVGHYILHGDVVELKDVVNHVGFILFDGAFFVADVDHHADFLFGDLLRLVIGADAEQTQDQVGAGGKNSHKGLGDGEHKADDRSDHQGNLFGMVHSDALGDQLTENKVKVCQQQGDGDQSDGLSGRQRHIRGKKGCKRLGEFVGGRTGCHKSGKGDTDLDGGEELGRL